VPAPTLHRPGSRSLAVAAALALFAWLPLAAAAATPPFAGGSQDMLRTGGPQAAQILDLWRLMLAVCGLVFAAVLAAFGLALWRARRGTRETPPELQPSLRGEPRSTRLVAWAVGASAVGLFGLVFASVLTDRALAGLPLRDALHVELTAHQWWWQARYDAADPSRMFETANELHLPAGRPVLLTLKADDVIHSFWVPNLAGKKDLIPGRTATLALRADVPGRYRGQCAEFCGLQHAGMALEVVVESPSDYAAWAERQRQPAAAPADPQARRGQQLFLAGTCVMCHAIQGTDASARRAPDLTHLAGRARLGAGVLPNTREQLAAWIADPAAHKPGVNMPGHRYAREDLDALAAYLETLR
jgi:cytochrome c oxidase subunit 2